MKLFLAPMADITDSLFRKVCYFAGADICYSEMVSAKAIKHGSLKSVELAEVLNDEKETFIQLFGSEPDSFDYAVKFLQDKFDFAGFDINMGCPVKKVLKSGSGAALMENPILAAEIIRTVKKASEKPLSVKIRKGFAAPNSDIFAKIAEDEGADFLVIHPRLRTEMFGGISDWELSVKTAEKSNLKVVHSGDIKSFTDADYFRESKLYGLMIGRGILSSPWLFSEIKNSSEATEKFKKDIIKYHFDLISSSAEDERKKLLKLKKHSAWYSAGLRNGAKFRESIMKSDWTLNDMKLYLYDFFSL